MLDSYDIPDLLANLVERSLVACDSVTGRHHMTESMRAYAMEHLSEEDDKARKRHLDFFTQKAEQLANRGRNGEEGEAYLAYISDIDNYRTAVEWSLHNDPSACLHLAACLCLMWTFWSQAESRQNSLRILEAVPDGAVEDQIWLRLQLAHLSMRQSDLALADKLLTRAMKDLETHDDPAAKAFAMGVLSWYKREAGDLAGGLALTLQLVQYARDHDLPRNEAIAYTHLGEIARERGDFVAAEGYYLEALAKCGSVHRSALNLLNLGFVSIEKGDPDAAEQHLLQGFALVEGPTLMPIVPGLLTALGMALVQQGDYRRAGLLMGWSQAWRDARGSKLDAIDQALLNRMQALGQESGGEVFRETFKEGTKLSYLQVTNLVRDPTLDHLE